MKKYPIIPWRWVGFSTTMPRLEVIICGFAFEVGGREKTEKLRANVIHFKAIRYGNFTLPFEHMCSDSAGHLLKLE
jgi:hypothetical protein